MPTPYKVLSRPSEITPPPAPEGSGSIPASGSGAKATLQHAACLALATDAKREDIMPGLEWSAAMQAVWKLREAHNQLIAAVKNLRDQKGRHNTGLAYDGLMKTLDALSQNNKEEARP